MARIFRESVLPWLGMVFFLSLSGCIPLPAWIQGERPLGGDKGPQRKTVVAKEAPSLLVAIDGTICLVPGAKYESVKVDDKVWCDWRPRGGHPSNHHPRFQALLEQSRGDVEP